METYRPSVEVLGNREHQSFTRCNLLHLVSPLARNLDGRLDSLSAGVHRQDHVIAKRRRDLLGPDGKDIVVESARAERQPASLLGQGLDQLGVAVTLVDGAVGGKEVEVVLALGIPHVHSLGAGEDDG